MRYEHTEAWATSMLFYQSLGIFLALLGMVLTTSGTLFKGRLSGFLTTAGFALVGLPVIWMTGLLIYILAQPATATQIGR